MLRLIALTDRCRCSLLRQIRAQRRWSWRIGSPATAGSWEFMALSDAARRYETAWHRDATLPPQATAALRESAENALQALGQRRDFMRRAAMSSAKLT